MNIARGLGSLKRAIAEKAAGRAANVRARSLRRILASLVLATTLPLVTLAAIMYSQILGSQREFVRSSLMSNALTLAALVDNEIDLHMFVASGLATSVSLQEGDLVGFRQQAETVLKSIPGATLSLANPASLLLMSTQTPFGAPLPVRAYTEGQKTAFATGKPQVSDMLTGALSNKPVALLDYPVFRNGEPAYMIVVALSSARFLDLLRGKFSEDGTVGILDRKLNFVARIPDHEARVGTPASDGWQAEIRKAQQGFAEVTTLEGQSSLTAYAPTKYGWTVGISNPVSTINAPVNRIARSMGALSLFLIAGSLLLGYLVARHLSAVMTGLAIASQKLGRGEIVEFQPAGLKEANFIHQTLSDSSRELGRRANAMRESEARFRGTFENVAVGVAMLSTGGEWLEVNARLADMLGRESSSFSSGGLLGVIHAESAEEFARRFAEVAERRTEVYKDDLRMVRADGTSLWVGVTLSAQRKTVGKPDYLILHVRDISKRVEAQDHQKFMLHELAHRSKNQLSIVRAMAGQTARRAVSLDEFMEVFDKRTHSLSISTDLLVSQGWKRASLRELVQRQSGVFAEMQERIRAEGPDVEIETDAAEALGLALHELGTNAVKYGALSNQTGVVTVSWKPSEAVNGERALRLEWRELGGPPVSPPKRTGFGAMVIGRMVSQKVGALAHTAYDAEGFVWTLEIPAAHFTIGAAGAADETKH